MKTVFLDSSVLFTAVNSPSGGSSKLFTLEKIALTTSPYVLSEVERNIRKKLLKYHLDRFFLLVSKLKILKQNPDKKLIRSATKATVLKDAAILAEAKQANADILATLDKKHLLTHDAEKFLKPIKIMTPKMIIKAL